MKCRHPNATITREVREDCIISLRDGKPESCVYGEATATGTVWVECEDCGLCRRYGARQRPAWLRRAIVAWLDMQAKE